MYNNQNKTNIVLTKIMYRVHNRTMTTIKYMPTSMEKLVS